MKPAKPTARVRPPFARLFDGTRARAEIGYAVAQAQSAGSHAQRIVPIIKLRTGDGFARRWETTRREAANEGVVRKLSDANPATSSGVVARLHQWSEIRKPTLLKCAVESAGRKPLA